MTRKNPGATPINGTADQPVNAVFEGPDSTGLLNALPPVVAFGAAAAPYKAQNGVTTPKLGIGGAQSPKTHG